MSNVKTRGATGTTGGRLTVVQGTAMYVGAVLGTGVIALPALAAEAAGPASLIAWLALVLLSAPLAATFAALGGRYPDAGGVATYARLAFGDKASAVVGYWFYLAIPTGGVAATMFGGAYVASALGGGYATTVGAAAVVMLVVTVTNLFGVKLTGRVQLVLALLLVGLLVASIVFSLPHAKADNFQPFAPYGWDAIGPAAFLLVWSFVGWEAITYLTGEFRNPRRDVPIATAAAVVLVGVLYLALAATVIAVLGSGAAESEAPLGDLMARGLGGNARLLAAGAALLLTLGAMNAYYSGSAKLGSALGRDGALPAWFSRGSLAGEVPRRSLMVVVVLSSITLLVVALAGLEAKPLVQITTGNFLAVYAMGVAAAIKLLPRRSKARLGGLLSLGAVALLLAVSGIFLIWPVLIAVAGLLYLRFSRRGGRAVPDKETEAAEAEITQV
jgi:amino acid efflux transporter